MEASAFQKQHLTFAKDHLDTLQHHQWENVLRTNEMKLIGRTCSPLCDEDLDSLLPWRGK